MQPTPPVSVQPLQPGWLAPSSGVTGSSPSPLLSKEPPRSVFHAQYAPPDWYWADVLQDETQPVLLQDFSCNSLLPLPALGCAPLMLQHSSLWGWSLNPIGIPGCISEPFPVALPRQWGGAVHPMGNLYFGPAVGDSASVLHGPAKLSL